MIIWLLIAGVAGYLLLATNSGSQQTVTDTGGTLRTGVGGPDPAYTQVPDGNLGSNERPYADRATAESAARRFVYTQIFYRENGVDRSVTYIPGG